MAEEVQRRIFKGELEMVLGDVIILVSGVLGTGLCVYQLYLNDWDLEKMMFGEDDGR